MPVDPLFDLILSVVLALLPQLIFAIIDLIFQALGQGTL